MSVLLKYIKSMFSTKRTDWKLLARYLADEASEKDTAMLLSWAQKKPGNNALLNEVKMYWKKMDSMDAKFNVDNAWSKLQNRIVADERPVEKLTIPVKPGNRRTLWLSPMRVAAAVLLLILSGTVLLVVSRQLQRVNIITAQDDANRVVTLPDGSKVYLNENTRLTYSRHFNTRSRVVKLAGEAYFEVTADKDRPFSIHAGKACVKVLGTRFNVNAAKNNEQVEVFVTSGLVELSDLGNEENRVLLHPGSIGLYHQRKVTSRMAENENCIAWKTGRLTFTDTPISEATAVLNDVYNVNIVITGPGMDTTRINGAYQDNQLETILEVICTQNHLTLAKTGDTIYLSR